MRTALEDVERSLIEQAEVQLERREPAQASARAVELASTLYDEGLTDFLAVIDAQQAPRDVEDLLAASETSAALETIRLHEALGGGWEVFESGSCPRPRRSTDVASTRDGALAPVVDEMDAGPAVSTAFERCMVTAGLRSAGCPRLPWKRGRRSLCGSAPCGGAGGLYASCASAWSSAARSAATCAALQTSGVARGLSG